MKLVEAIIRLYQEKPVIAALEAEGVDEIYTSRFNLDATQFSIGANTIIYGGKTHAYGSIPRIKVEALVEDDRAREIKRIIEDIISEGRPNATSVEIKHPEQVIDISSGKARPEQVRTPQVAQKVAEHV